jgi:hypothetical protein
VCRAQETYRVMTAIGPQEQTLTKGRYKVLPNHVRTRDGEDHSYAPVDVTPAEMARLVAEIRTEPFLSAHPVIQAAYAHYCLVVIHPFADGNGRVARALASAFTYRAISMPIMILSEQKGAYLDALEVADRGDYQAFVDFMSGRSLDTIRLVNESALNGLSPTVEQGVAAIDRLFVTRGGYSQDQVDGAGRQLMELTRSELTKIMVSKSGKNLNGQATSLITRGQSIAMDSDHRLLVNAEQDLTLLHVELTTSTPAYARVFRNYAIWLPIDAAGDDDLQLVRILDEGNQVLNRLRAPAPAEKAFSARMDELVPSPSGVLQISMGIFAERAVGEMLAELKPLAQKALRGES